LQAYALRCQPLEHDRHPAWLSVLRQGFRHVTYCLEAVEEEKTRGFLPLAYVHSFLFGRFLVSLPYLDYGGVLADDDHVARLLIDGAIQLAEQLDVRYLELRHERSVFHPALVPAPKKKLNVRLPLPPTPGELWEQLPGKVRNQVRKGQKNGLSVAWGGQDLLPAYYSVFSRNMRDLGTPVYGRRLFRAILEHFPDRAEFCVVRAGEVPVAGALLLHGWGVSRVPSASSLRSFNHTNANMLMYWHLLQRAVERRQTLFDFGRCSPESNTHRFKMQWGAADEPAQWQYHLRSGSASDMRPENPRYGRMIRLWQRLPVSLTRWIGPAIVRGIP
jgi:FemAB-related protein (PEP-CTERM system-associated)